MIIYSAAKNRMCLLRTIEDPAIPAFHIQKHPSDCQRQQRQVRHPYIA